MKKILIVCGPTASGKTKVAIALAQLFKGELVSADSRQIYKGMDIGTGKDLEENKIIPNSTFAVVYKGKQYSLSAYKIGGVPIWMYDVVSPNEDFSVSHYQFLARNVINNIIKRDKLSIVVGGTGFYIKSLISDIDTLNIPVNVNLRQKLDKMTVRELQDEMQESTPDIFEKMNQSDRSNPRRLIRKLEIAEALKNFPEFTTHDRKYNNENILTIGLTAPLNYIYQRIDTRVIQRIDMGIEQEIENLFKIYGTWDLPAFSGMGYRIWETWTKKPANRNADLKAEIIRKWQFEEHAYARRQMIWFRKQPNIEWFEIDHGKYLKNVIDTVKSWYNQKSDDFKN
jgi:tRNA dimethylallyltransferase